MKPENKQRFSIRKYAIGAASVLIGLAFHAQAVAADGVVPTTTENQPTIQAAGESSPQASEEKLESSQDQKRQKTKKLLKLKLL